MTMWKRWIQGGVLYGLLLTGVVGCSMVWSPPVAQIAPNDHAALVAWYDKEAAQLRQKAKDMEIMQQRYIKDPHLGHAGEQRVNPKFDMVQHCNNLIGIYTKAAEEADELARGHRSMVK